MNELMIRPVTAFSFKNAELTKISEEIAAQGNGLAGNINNIASLLGKVKSGKLYGEDGFKSVEDYAGKTFSLGRAQAYQMSSVGERFINNERFACNMLDGVKAYSYVCLDTDIKEVRPFGPHGEDMNTYTDAFLHASSMFYSLTDAMQADIYAATHSTISKMAELLTLSDEQIMAGFSANILKADMKQKEMRGAVKQIKEMFDKSGNAKVDVISDGTSANNKKYKMRFRIYEIPNDPAATAKFIKLDDMTYDDIADKFNDSIVKVFQKYDDPDATYVMEKDKNYKNSATNYVLAYYSKKLFGRVEVLEIREEAAKTKTVSTDKAAILAEIERLQALLNSTDVTTDTTTNEAT